jgi:hypothetical protein
MKEVGSYAASEFKVSALSVNPRIMPYACQLPALLGGLKLSTRRPSQYDFSAHVCAIQAR